jgi:hypothetical protein
MPPKESSVCPHLHERVWAECALSGVEYNLKTASTKEKMVRCYDTTTVGRFECSNKACSAPPWWSYSVGLTIRGYKGRRYYAVLWHQECYQCRQFGRLSVRSQDYVNQVSRCLRYWSGIRDEKPSSSKTDRKTKPHKSEYCAGCKNGHCRQSKQDLADLFGNMTIT